MRDLTEFMITNKAKPFIFQRENDWITYGEFHDNALEIAKVIKTFYKIHLIIVF